MVHFQIPFPSKKNNQVHHLTKVIQDHQDDQIVFKSKNNRKIYQNMLNLDILHIYHEYRLEII